MLLAPGFLGSRRVGGILSLPGLVGRIQGPKAASWLFVSSVVMVVSEG